MRKKGILSFYKMRDEGDKVTWLTAYDAPTASLAEQAGIEMLLVGDSVGMCVYGYDGTNPMTMQTMIPHTAAVRRAAPNTFVIGDMPFLSYQVSSEEAVRNAGAFVQQAGADAVKLEGGDAWRIESVRFPTPASSCSPISASRHKARVNWAGSRHRA